MIVVIGGDCAAATGLAATAWGQNLGLRAKNRCGATGVSDHKSAVYKTVVGAGSPSTALGYSGRTHCG